MSQVSNPILPGFHPDPSILRVGDEYYIANSTFEWFPGVEIHRSKDLANWTPVAAPLSTRGMLDLVGNPPSGGIWAPCLSWADGKFWLIFTDVKHWHPDPFKDTPNYLTCAERIEGPWSDPVFLNGSGFDASLFHDEDGRKWLVNQQWDYRKPGRGKFHGIVLTEYDPLAGRLKGEPRRIYDGTPIGLVEGPHLYRREGWYYLVCAEGGTEYGHAVTIARSRSIEGPYETHPLNPLVSSRGAPEHPLQKAGHGSLVDTPDGRSFIAFLVGRPLPGTTRCVLGRETALAELVWTSGWPRLLDGTSLPPPSFEALAPRAPAKERRYDFSDPECLLDWKTLRSPMDPRRYSLSERKGALRLRGGESLQSRHWQTLIARRQEHFAFDVETELDFEPADFHRMAGLVYRYDERSQYYLRVSRDEKLGRCMGILSFVGGEFSLPLGEEEQALPAGPIRLGLSVRASAARFRWAPSGGAWREIGPELDASVLSDDFAALGFTGAFVGLACQDAVDRSACADFLSFVYAPR